MAAMESWQAEHHRQLSEYNERIKQLETRVLKIEEMHKSIWSLTESVSNMAVRMEGLKEDVTEIKKSVESFAAIPSKRWETIVGVALTALVSGLVGIAIAQFFK